MPPIHKDVVWVGSSWIITFFFMSIVAFRLGFGPAGIAANRCSTLIIHRFMFHNWKQVEVSVMLTRFQTRSLQLCSSLCMVDSHRRTAYLLH